MARGPKKRDEKRPKKYPNQRDEKRETTATCGW